MTMSIARLPSAGNHEPEKPPPVWSFSIAETIGGEILADLPFDDVNFDLPLNDSGTFGASITFDERIAPEFDVRDLTTPVRRSWYAKRDDVPIYGGIIWTSAYDSESMKLQIGGADFWSYFDLRKIVSTAVDNLPDDPDWIANLVFTLNNIDQNSAVRSVVSLAQGHPGGNIGIQYDTTFSGILRDHQWFGYDLKDVGEAIKQMTEVLDGQDVRFIVVADPTATGGVRRRLLQGQPSLGQVGSEHFFEYGMNLTKYTWPRDGGGMRTRAYALGDGIAEGMPIALSQDSDLYDQNWPVLEGETSYSTVREFATLQEHAEADQVAARAPIVLPTLTVKSALGPTIGEVNPGDDARLVIKDAYWGFDPGLDTLVRITNVGVSYSASGGEEMVLTCAPLVEGII